MKIRNERVSADGSKYVYFSSRKYGGCGPGSPCHIPLGVTAPAPLVRITEGELKADVIFALTGVPTISFPGVDRWPIVLPVLKELGATTVRTAFDADSCANKIVAQRQLDCLRELVAKGYAIEMEVWDLAVRKGLDNLLAAGKQPEVLTGDAAMAKAVEIAAAHGIDPNPTAGNSGMAPADNRKEIEIDHEEHRCNALAAAEIGNDPNIFCRAGQLVDVVKIDGAPRIRQLPLAMLRHHLTAVAKFVQVKQTEEGEDRIPVHPPEWLVKAVAAPRRLARRSPTKRGGYRPDPTR